MNYSCKPKRSAYRTKKVVSEFQEEKDRKRKAEAEIKAGHRRGSFDNPNDPRID